MFSVFNIRYGRFKPVIKSLSKRLLRRRIRLWVFQSSVIKPKRKNGVSLCSCAPRWLICIRIAFAVISGYGILIVWSLFMDKDSWAQWMKDTIVQWSDRKIKANPTSTNHQQCRCQVSKATQNMHRRDQTDYQYWTNPQKTVQTQVGKLSRIIAKKHGVERIGKQPMPYAVIFKEAEV